MKYLFDNCLSFRFARMLSALGEHEVVALRELLPEDTKDLDLFPQLKGSGFVFVTFDDRQRTRLAEAQAIRESGVTVLWLGPFWSKLAFWDQARWLMNRWPVIHGYASGVTPGTCAELKQNGKSQPFSL